MSMLQAIVHHAKFMIANTSWGAARSRAAAAERWSQRAKGWQAVIDDPNSYVNYENGYVRFNAMLEGVMATMQSPRCLDIGCGNGDVARQMAAAGASRVIGIDISEGMIEEARRLTEDKRVYFRPARLRQVRESGSYDVLASRGVVLSHLPTRDVRGHLRDITRLSKAGSYAVIDFIQRIENGQFQNVGFKNVISVDYVRQTMRQMGWVPVAQDGDEHSRVIVAAFHRPFPDSVYFVTSNPMKLLEMRSAARHPHLHGCNFDLPELKHDSIEKIAEEKALMAFGIVRRPVLCTDGGIFMDAYDGFPGPNSKQAATKLRPEGLLRLLVGVENRSGRRMNAAAFFDGEKMSVQTQTVKVRFAEEPRGTYPSYPMDKILIPLNDDNAESLTYAEMPPEERGRFTELPALAEFAQKMAKCAG